MSSSVTRPSRFASAVSTRTPLDAAVSEVCDTATQSLDGSPRCAIFFVTHEYAEQWSELGGQLSERLGTENLIGCSAEGVICGRQEIEEGPALTLWVSGAATMEVTPIRLQFQRTPEGGAIVGWPDSLIAEWPAGGTLLLLADPFTFPADYLLQQINDEHPRFPVLGGMASGATGPDRNRLFEGTRCHATGAVGWMIQGGVQVASVVSQGCRPVGETFVVTAAERNLIHQLGGKPALEQLQHVFQQLPTHEQELLQRGLHLGRVVNEYQDEFQTGDFLIRNVMGIDRESGAIAVGDYLRPGQTVQFQLRDERGRRPSWTSCCASDTPSHHPKRGCYSAATGAARGSFRSPTTTRR